MEEALAHHLSEFPTWVLFIIVIVSLGAVGKGADVLVDQAVGLSIQWGIPKSVIGATIVSLGTTMPEAAISVLAAVKGSPGLALGNAVGSIICDTGLILGLAILIRPLPIDRSIVNRQGWLQLGAGILLVLGCFPWASPTIAFSDGGNLAQWTGVVFLILLGLYLWKSMDWAKGSGGETELENESGESGFSVGGFVKLVSAIAVVILSSWILIPAVREIAIRLSIPPSIIAATMVAFGTSLPELVTAVTATYKGHGELALGNIIGADILNVLFVAGASAAVTAGGLQAPSHFFKILFPAMLFVLILLRVGVTVSGTQMKRPFGVILLLAYVLVTYLSYALKPTEFGH